MKILYFDCSSGISGDMTIGALLDAGLDIKLLENELSKLGLKGFQIRKRRVRRNSIMGTKFEVIRHPVSGIRHPGGRSLKEIENLLEKSKLDAAVKDMSFKVFRKLARAESRVHGKPISDIHFHEVGNIDSIVDIVGTAIAINKLNIDALYSSPLRLGTGFTCFIEGHGKTKHSRLPVPPPASLEMLKGKDVLLSDIPRELVTPTGAAIITALSKQTRQIPPMRISHIGYGAGSRELKEIPNLLRVIIGEAVSLCITPSAKSDAPNYLSDTVTVLETNIDDMSPINYGYIFERLLKAGALDVSLTSIQMKKSRPGTQLQVLLPQHLLDKITAVVFEETPTLGVRYFNVQRRKLAREISRLKTGYGQIRAKIGKIDGRVMTVSPEYEDCKRIAVKKGIPFREVYEKAKRAAME